jgi:class 3 adenylate cyclase
MPHALYLDPGHTALQARGVRAGIHIGSVDVVGEDIFGTEVDVAARIVGGIECAEIWLSDQAKRDLERAARAVIGACNGRHTTVCN